MCAQEKKKTIVGSKEESNQPESTAPESVFVLDALKDALPAPAPAASTADEAASTEQQAAQGGGDHGHAGRKGAAGSSAAGGRGAGAGGSAQWSRETGHSNRTTTKGGRGGGAAVTGRGQGQGHQGPGRTVEVTPTAGGSYLIEKPPASGESAGGVRGARPPREEGAGGGGRGFGSKQTGGGGRGVPTAAGATGSRPAREPRPPRGPNGVDSSTAGANTGVEAEKVESSGKAEAGSERGAGAVNRPKSGGAASGKLFSKAMDQASSGGGKGPKKVSR